MRRILFAITLLGISAVLSAQNPFIRTMDAPQAVTSNQAVATNAVDCGHSGSWLPDFLVAWQRGINETIARHINDLARDGAGGTFFVILLLAFVYGILHAVGPGHGKAVFAAWALSARRTLRSVILTPLLAALLHAGSALALVGGTWLVLSRLVTPESGGVERILVILAVILLFGLGVYTLVIWFLRVTGRIGQDDAAGSIEKSPLSLIFAVGLVPCPISSILLVFSFSAGLVWQGIVFVLAFALGMGLTMSAVALAARAMRSVVASREHRVLRVVTDTVLPLLGALFYILAALMMLAMLG